MSHVSEQARAREAKKLKREQSAKLAEENRIKVERHKNTVYLDIDYDTMRSLLYEALPEGAELEVIIPNGKGGWLIRAQRKTNNA